MKIELIPVIELGFEEEESHFIQPHPDNEYWLNSKGWEKYFEKEVERNGYENYVRIKEGYPFYRVNQFKSKKDLLKLIQFHLGKEDDENRTPLKESCALFGGYVLIINKKIIFTPQCCSLLSDFLTWKAIIQEEFKEGYICLEGHPCPKVERKGNKLNFTFKEEWEDFIPPAINSTVDRSGMIRAVEKCQIELDEFEVILNSFEGELNQTNVGDILIYQKE